MKVDWGLILPIVFLLSLGMLVLRSVAPQQVGSQLVFMFLFWIVFIIFSRLDFQIPIALQFPLYIFSLLFLLAPYLFGEHTRGAVRWLQFGQYTVQPSEIVKPFLIVTYCVLATSAHTKRTVALIASLLIPWLIVFFQPDLGTSLVLFSGWAVVFLSRFSVKSVVLSGFVMLLIGITAAIFVLKPYQHSRLTTFLNPYRDPLGEGYHIIQSLTTVGSGQLVGRGLGQGPQSQLRFLPEHHTDFIFAAMAEELGFMGAVVVLALYTILFWRIYRISQTTTDPTLSLICLASLSQLTFQTFINIGMNIGITPITGVTLPFMSAGGSSLLSLGITFGLIHAISTNNK